MAVLALAWQYFAETTVHGFRYVSPGASRSTVERWAWVAAISAAVLVSGLLLFKSVHEAYVNPIATTTEMVPITETVSKENELQCYVLTYHVVPVVL